jgi:hypothetical protein
VGVTLGDAYGVWQSYVMCVGLLRHAVLLFMRRPSCICTCFCEYWQFVPQVEEAISVAGKHTTAGHLLISSLFTHITVVDLLPCLLPLHSRVHHTTPICFPPQVAVGISAAETALAIVKSALSRVVTKVVGVYASCLLTFCLPAAAAVSLCALHQIAIHPRWLSPLAAQRRRWRTSSQR